MRKLCACVLSIGVLVGCQGPGLFSTVTSDVTAMLKDPAVKESIRQWSADVDVTNPRIYGFTETRFGVGAEGIITRARADGSGGKSESPVPEAVPAPQSPAPKGDLQILITDIDPDEDKGFGRLNGKLVVVRGAGGSKGATVSAVLESETEKLITANIVK